MAEGTIHDDENALRRVERQLQAETHGTEDFLIDMKKKEDSGYFVAVHRRHEMDQDRLKAASWRGIIESYVDPQV